MFSNKNKFFKLLEPGTILHQHFWIGHSHWFMLFEFGHFDDDTGYVYWQRAKIKFQDNMVFVSTADINNDMKVYEQMELGKISDIGIVRKAMQNEIIFFEEHLDEYLVKLWFNGVINKNNVVIGSYLDGRLSMLKLVAEPPVYTYARITGDYPEDVFIFKTAPLCYDNNGKFIINAKEMLLINDEVRLIEHDETMMVCYYSEVTALREATDSERKLLLIKADDKKKNTTVEREYSFMHKTSALMSFEKALKPFSTKVLVSDGQCDIWRPAIFGCIVDDDVQRYMIVGGQKYKFCVPYRQFKNLLGKKFENVLNMV